MSSRQLWPLGEQLANDKVPDKPFFQKDSLRTVKRTNCKVIVPSLCCCKQLLLNLEEVVVASLKSKHAIHFRLAGTFSG